MSISLYHLKDRNTSCFVFPQLNRTAVNYILKEVENVFLEKFPHKTNEIKKFIGGIKYRKFDLGEMNISLYPKIRDISDFPILVAAIESNVDILITGDKDFDEITIDRPMIMKPRKFIDEYMN